MPRLVDPKHPAAYRVLISTDPVTTEKVAGGKHVGQTVYAIKAKLIALPDITGHDLAKIRKLMLATLRDGRIPRATKPDRALARSNVKAGKLKRASAEKYKLLAASFNKFYRHKKQRLNQTIFKKDFDLFRAISKIK